jgi:hypothetical protein
MPKYVIEREIPGVGNLKPEELQAISQKSCGVLTNMGPQIQWVESFVTQDKIYCVYISPNEKMVREHASQGGFPANKVSEVKTIINPTTAEWSEHRRPRVRPANRPSRFSSDSLHFKASIKQQFSRA